MQEYNVLTSFSSLLDCVKPNILANSKDMFSGDETHIISLIYDNEGDPKLAGLSLLCKSSYHLNITNVTILWHNLLNMQPHIQIRLLLSNETLSDVPHTKSHAEETQSDILTIIIYLNIVCHLRCNSLIFLYVTYKIGPLKGTSKSLLPSNQAIVKKWTFCMVYILL